MSSSKIVIVVLVLLAVLFTVSMALGVHFNGEGRATCDDDSPGDRCAQNCKAGCIPGWAEGLSGMFESFRPKLKLSDLTVPDQRALTSPLQPLVPITIQIPAAEASFFKPSMRTATFRLTNGVKATIEYAPQSPELIEQSELRKPQSLTLPRDENSKENDDLLQGSLAVVARGGKLIIICSGPIPCQLELK